MAGGSRFHRKSGHLFQSLPSAAGRGSELPVYQPVHRRSSASRNTYGHPDCLHRPRYMTDTYYLFRLPHQKSHSPFGSVFFLRTVSASEWQNLQKASHIFQDMLHPERPDVLQHPYFHKGKYNYWTDDSIYDGNPEKHHKSDQEYNPDCLPILRHMEYPGIKNERFPSPKHPPEKKKPLSSHYRRHHYIRLDRSLFLSYSSSLPVSGSPDDDKYSGAEQHPGIHPLSF